MEYQFESFTPEKSNHVESLHFEIGDPRVIFDMICNRIYSKPLETAIQEYMTNARDAHRESGCGDVPISVSLPTKLDKSIHIRDFGVGISPDRMANVFVKIGESTKRDSNLETGGFGVGAKSAFAYTDNFTIDTIYDGIRRTYLAYIGDKGLGDMDLILEEESDQPNTTDISFLIKDEDVGHLLPILTRTALFWPVSPTLKNTHIDFNDAYIQPRLVKGGNKWGYFEFNTDSDTFEWAVKDTTGYFACCDGILYPMELHEDFQEIFGKIKGNGHGLVFFFDVGEIDLAITRENLQYTKKTKEAIKIMCENLINRHTDAVIGLKGKDITATVSAMHKHLENTPYLSSLEVEIRDGIFIRNNRKDEKIKVRIANMPSVVTRTYTIDEEMVRTENVLKGIELAPDIPLIVNDKSVTRITGAKIRGCVEAIKSGSYRAKIVTLPVNRADNEQVYRYSSYDGVSQEDIQEFEEVIPILKELGFHMLSDFKAVKGTSIGTTEVYLQEFERYGRTNRVKVQIDDIINDPEVIVIPRDKIKDINSYVFKDFINKYSRVMGKSYQIYLIHTKRAQKILDRAKPYYKFFDLMKDIDLYMRGLDSDLIECCLLRNRDTYSMKIPTLIDALRRFRTDLPLSFQMDLDRIDSVKDRYRMVLQRVRDKRKDFGDDYVPRVRTVDELIKLWPKMSLKGVPMVSAKRRIKHNQIVMDREKDVVLAIVDQIQRKYPLIFRDRYSNGLNMLMTSDVIPYINLKGGDAQ